MKIKISKEEMAKKVLHSPDEAHMRECISGHRTTKNKKKYTRKCKHKNNLF